MGVGGGANSGTTAGGSAGTNADIGGSVSARTTAGITAGIANGVTAATTAGTTAGVTAATTSVIVDVEGKVAHPCVLTLPAGSRVYEALAAAGGALPGVDATGLDLARPLTAGEQLRVGIAGEPSPAVGVAGPVAGGRGKHKGGRVVDLNSATLDELENIPDVGPAMAQRILDWRAAHGRFTSVGQLRQVRGIGERKFAEMRDSVTVTP